MSVLWLFLWKELRDVRRNPQLLPGYLLLPPIAIFLPAVITALAPQMMQVDPNDPVMKAIVRLVAATPEFQGYGQDEAITRYLLRNLIVLFFIMPVGLSSIGAAFSIVAEKQQRTLEPILATPIRDQELMLGKLLAVAVPAIGLTWLSAVICVVLVDIISYSLYGRLLLPDAFWLIGIMVLAPLLGVCSVLAAMRLSAKMTDPQSANQMTALVIVPAFMLAIGVFGKVLALNLTAAFGAGAVLALVAVLLFRWNVRHFQREEILTRWK